MSDETLYIYDRNTDYKLPPFGRYQKVARPDALSLFTDSELIGELVRRGVNTFIVQREHGYLPSGVYWWPVCFAEEFAPCTPQEGDHGSCGAHYLVDADLVEDSEERAWLGEPS